MPDSKWGDRGIRRSGNLRKGRWSEAEVARLRDWYGLRDEDTIARDLRRSPASVRKKAQEVFRLGVHSGPWTSNEVQSLKRYLGANTTEIIARILGRTEQEIDEQILRLGRIQKGGRWSREERAEFKRLYGTRTDEDLAKIFSRGLETVRTLARRLHLAKDKAFLRKLQGSGTTRMPRWGPKEIEILVTMYSDRSNLEIAEALGRSVKSVVSKAHHMGLKKNSARLRRMGRENVSLRYNSD